MERGSIFGTAPPWKWGTFEIASHLHVYQVTDIGTRNYKETYIFEKVRGKVSVEPHIFFFLLKGFSVSPGQKQMWSRRGPVLKKGLLELLRSKMGGGFEGHIPILLIYESTQPPPPTPMLPPSPPIPHPTHTHTTHHPCIQGGTGISVWIFGVNTFVFGNLKFYS